MKTFLQNIRMVLMVLLVVAGVSEANARRIAVTVNVSATTVGTYQQITITPSVERYAVIAGMGYRLSYYTDKDKTKKEIEHMDNSDFTAKFKYTPEIAGTYHFVVDVHDYVSDWDGSAEATVKVVNPSLDLTSSSSAINAGESCTLTATPGYLNAKSYTFYVSRYGVDSGWNKLSTGKSPTYTFSPKEEGFYQFYVCASDGNQDQSSETIGVNVNKVNSYVKVSSSTDKIYNDESFSLTATPICCTPVKYKYYYKKEGKKAYVCKTETTKNTCKLNLEAGKYTFKVETTTDDGNVLTSYVNDAVTIYEAPSVEVSVSPEDNYVGTPVTISATTENFDQVIFYNFYYSIDGGKNYKEIAYLSTESSVSFTPTETGTYRFKVQALGTHPLILVSKDRTITDCKDVTISQPTQEITPNSDELSVKSAKKVVKNGHIFIETAKGTDMQIY